MDEQRSKEWFLQRAGLITASKMSVIMNGGRKAWITYMNRIKEDLELKAKGEVRDEVSAKPLEWGREQEDHALSMYELEQNIDVVVPGFVVHPNVPYVGASSDFLRGKFINGEIKCPSNTENHVEAAMYSRMPMAHYPQVQGQMWVHGSELTHFLSYDPRYPVPRDRLITVIVIRDEEYIAKMATKCAEFWHVLETGEWPEEEIPNLF